MRTEPYVPIGIRYFDCPKEQVFVTLSCDCGVVEGKRVTSPDLDGDDLHDGVVYRVDFEFDDGEYVQVWVTTQSGSLRWAKSSCWLRVRDVEVEA